MRYMVQMGQEPSGLEAALDSAPAKLFQTLVGDWLSLGTAAYGGVRHFREKWQERRRERATVSPMAAAERLISGLGSLTRDQYQCEAEHLLLIADAFFAAWLKCRELGKVPSLQEDWLKENLPFRLERCWVGPMLAEHTSPSPQQQTLDWLTGPPTRTPYYKALWQALTDPSFGEILIPVEHDADGAHSADVVRAFENFFHAAYYAGLASPGGQTIQRYLRGQRAAVPALMRWRLAVDMADWRSRPIAHFGGHPLPQSELYVEPNASLKDGSGRDGDHVPLFALLETLLGPASQPRHQIVVVQAPPGIGKSLAAREISCRTAQAFLQGSTANGLRLPIFVQSDVLLEARNQSFFDIPELLRAALHAHGQALQEKHSQRSDCYLPPSDQESTLIVIDDVDAAQLGKDKQHEFLHKLRKLDGRHQAILFTRPTGLDSGVLAEFEAQVITLQPFVVDGTNSQVQEWLARWNLLTRRDPPLRLVDLDGEDRRLYELSARPILLRLIAETWDSLSQGPKTQMRLFDEFTHQVVTLRREPAALPTRRPSDDVVGELALAALSRQDKQIVAAAERPEQALIWLLARLAWESVSLSEQRLPLTVAWAREILGTELGLREPELVIERLCDGSLLSTRRAAEGNTTHLLFGHDTFRQYLTALYWEHELRRLHKLPPDSPGALYAERLLAQGRLTPNVICFSMLIERLVTWPEPERQSLVTWATRCLLSESPSASQDGGSLVLHWAWLRETALALASQLQATAVQDVSEDMNCEPTAGVEIPNAQLLRSLAARIEEQGQTLLLHAPGLSISLHGAQGRRAFLAGLCVRRACLERATLIAVNLRGANLSESKLQGANLKEADLRGADLSGCDLSRADLRGADLRGADLSGAKLVGAKLDGARLDRAHLVAADLSSASLQRTKLESADLREARMNGVDLRHASLRQANLQRTTMWDARLGSADLAGADLEDARLSGARGLQVRAGRAWMRGVSWENSLLEWHPDHKPPEEFLREQQLAHDSDVPTGTSGLSNLDTQVPHDEAR